MQSRHRSIGRAREPFVPSPECHTRLTSASIAATVRSRAVPLVNHVLPRLSRSATGDVDGRDNRSRSVVHGCRDRSQAEFELTVDQRPAVGTHAPEFLSQRCLIGQRFGVCGSSGRLLEERWTRPLRVRLGALAPCWSRTREAGPDGNAHAHYPLGRHACDVDDLGSIENSSGNRRINLVRETFQVGLENIRQG